MEQVFQDDCSANGNTALTLGQLLTSNSQVPIDPTLMISDDHDNLPMLVHVCDGQKQSATSSGDPKKKKKAKVMCCLRVYRL
jgi:hypothetical protein